MNFPAHSHGLDTALQRRRIRVRGLVQGVGFRPHVYRCAARLGDTGLQSYALGTMGPLGWRVGSQQPPQTYYERALQARGLEPVVHSDALSACGLFHLAQQAP